MTDVKWKAFVGFHWDFLSRRNTLLVVLNLLYFGSILVGGLLAQIPGFVVYELPLNESSFFYTVDNVFLLVVTIFFFDLVVSGFFLTTLSGLVLFVLPFGVVLWRALLWGTMITQLSSPRFFAALPTFVLEGEAYVIAALVGVTLGLSWLKPAWAYRGEKISRREAFRRALREGVRLYVLVAGLLFVAAIVEAVTLVYVLTG